MNTRHQHEQPQRREGLGGRVRRFVDSELSRVLDGQDSEAGRTDPPIEGGRAEPPLTTTPVEPEHDHSRSRHAPTSEEAGTGQSPGHTSDETVADTHAERLGLLDDPAGLRDQWQRVQGTFVDDPQRAVHEASELVERTLQEIRVNVTRGQASDPTSTEDLRVSFQRYREFFQRLLSA